ncbi:MAG: hypothetical protein LBK73_00440 [Treponema sp.]|nr:hypothetical protein [Treponema sp.]
MKKIVFAFLVGFCVFVYDVQAEVAPAPIVAPLRFNVLYAGSVSFNAYKNTGTLENRIDGRFFLPLPTFYLRAELLERNAFPLDGFTAENLNWGAGLYHKGTGSRILYGALDEWGLSARIRNPWIRSAPFVDHHQPVGSDLTQEFSTKKEAKAVLFLASPDIDFFNGAASISGFVSATLDGALNPAFTGGAEVHFTRKTTLRVEGFWTGKELPPRAASGWFSEKFALPERAFHVFAVAFLWMSPWASVSSDWAFSEMIAFGRGVYGNIGVRIGKKPWLFSFAADGAGERFAGSDGSVPGQNARIAGKIERYGKKSSLFRVSTSLRSSGMGDLFEADCDANDVFAASRFERSSTGVYYRFPAQTKLPVRISRISLSADRNAPEGEAPQDAYKGEIGVQWWKLRSSFSCALAGVSGDNSSPYPAPEQWRLDSVRIAGSAAYSIGPFRFGVSVGYTASAKAEIADGSFSVAVQKKRRRFAVKIATSEFPTLWEFTLSGRFEW